MSSFTLKQKHHTEAYIPAPSIKPRELAQQLQSEFPWQIFAIIDHHGFAPRCIKLIEGIRDKIHLWMIRILSPDETAETEILIDGQFITLAPPTEQ